ncbi:MAG: hypothetical protein HY231_14455 [Acidobacteria bacterium]|nr:hypothetical protein [Acidobacteriota bacterium]
MKQLWRWSNLLLMILVLMVGAAFGQQANHSSLVREVESPAAVGSGEANLFATGDGRILMSWLEKLGDNHHALKFAIFKDSKWSAPKIIAQGKDWVVNWADFPSLIELKDGALMAHWLVKSSTKTFAYNIQIARSKDGGKTWSKPLVPHTDGTITEHGFVSLLPVGQGQAAAVWLDGRKFTVQEGDHGHSGHGAPTDEMTLRYAAINEHGKLSDEAQVDGRVCDCCQTSAVVTPEGVVVAYRDRSEKEVRDISIIRLVNGKWTAPHTLPGDDWQIEGCPVNGPSLAARENHVVVAWFTAAKDVPQVKIAFSKDSGATFTQAVQVDDGKPLGRIEAVMLPDHSALVVWLERTEKGAAIRARRLHADGSKGQSFTVAESNAARASGFPHVALTKNEIVFAWTQAATQPRVQVGVMKLTEVK